MAVSYIVIRAGGSLDYYDKAPLAEHVRRQVAYGLAAWEEGTASAEWEGFPDRVVRANIGDRMALAAWVNGHIQQGHPYVMLNVVASCMANILGGPRIAYAGDMVFTALTGPWGPGDAQRMASLVPREVGDLRTIHEAVRVCLGRHGKPNILQEAIAGRVRRWASEIPALPRPTMATVQLPGAPGDDEPPKE